MSIRDLRYVVALSETLHFGLAAKRCNVSQPTLSIQIKKLEDYLGVRIFERDRGKVMLTRDGEGIVRQARLAVAAFDRLRAQAMRSRGRRQAVATVD